MSSNVKEDYLKKAKDIFKLINDFRRNPKLLVRHLENIKKYLDRSSQVLSEPGKIQIQMVEGESVIDEAIDFLRSLPTLKPFDWEENLAMSALEHVLDIGPKGLLSYQSSDGTEPEERICKYGNYIESLGENIDFGPNDAIGVVVSLTLDDGEPDRPHRDNLFKSDYFKVGIACGPHKTEYQMCVMDFAYDFDGFNENNMPEEDEQEEKEFKSERNQVQTGARVSNDTITEENNAQEPLINGPEATDKHRQTTRGNQHKNQLDDFVEPMAQTANFIKNSKKSINTYEGTFGTRESDKKGFKAENLTKASQSPLVKLSLDDQEYSQAKKNMRFEAEREAEEELSLRVKDINLKKRAVSKYVEVTTKIVYTFEDGSTKETVDKQNHTFKLI